MYSFLIQIKKRLVIFKKYHISFLTLLICFLVIKTHAQLSFCTGNSGDPIFEDTFGSGATTQLPAGTTTYTYSGSQPNDGSYNVSSNTNWFGWFSVPDHTPNDTNGRMLIINASDSQAGEFYRTTINGLCENTTYEFSSWLINLLPSSHGCVTGGREIPINVRYEIWDSTDTTELESGDTGNIYATSSPNWGQYALQFQTQPGQTSVILKMRNNGVGGCGNDLAIDDIVFKPCGDTVIIEDAFNNEEVYICENNIPFSSTLSATPDFSVFSSHFYQWQESTDLINWIDIPGETNQSYATPLINTTAYYRVRVAEDIINLSNLSCNSTSEIFEVNIVTLPDIPISGGNLNICESDTTPLRVSVPSGVTVNWYDTAVGGSLLQSNSLSYNPTTSGIYFAEAETINGGCLSVSRIPLEVNYYEIPEVEDETLEFCQNTDITLFADTNIATVTYLWSTGETTENIIVDTPGVYTVDVTNVSCTITKTITLNQIDNPVIEGAYSDGKDIIVTTSNIGGFLYSIDGNSFQSSNTFTYVDGGLYTIYVKESNCDELITMEYLHFYIPKFFTPNNDGENDEFDLKGIEFYDTSSVSIFNRYGKLLKNSANVPFSWDGTFVGNQLPSDDYWYIIVIDGQKFTGHFTLKR